MCFECLIDADCNLSSKKPTCINGICSACVAASSCSTNPNGTQCDCFNYLLLGFLQVGNVNLGKCYSPDACGCD
jgi:hypothetical protein